MSPSPHGSSGAINTAQVAKEHDEIEGSVRDLVTEMDDLAVDLKGAVKSRVDKVKS